jgi:hypothetical protein
MGTFTTKQIGIMTANDLADKYELPAAEAFSPGHVLYITSARKFAKHAAGGQHVAPVIVAKEDELRGNGVDDAYVADNQAMAWICKPGAIVNMRVQDGQNLAIGDYVESAGDGTIRVYAADTFSGAEAVSVYPMNIIGIVMKACNMSSSSTVDPSPPFAAVMVR